MSSDPMACGDGCGCGSAPLPRRDFIRLAGLGALALAAARRPAMAGPFEASDFAHLVPADKKLSPDWVGSLFARGEPLVLRGDELRFVGMPVGGIGTGQLYLGGDGRLWHWDIFNRHLPTGSAHYEHPPTPSSPLASGFTLRIDGQVRPLDRTGFSDVSFRGAYPVGTVEYRDPAAPVAVTLEAFSPFAPLALDDSSLPATVLHFTVRNTSALELTAIFTGELENAVCHYSPHAAARRRIRVVGGAGFTFLECLAEPSEIDHAHEIVFENWTRPFGADWTVGQTCVSRAFRIEQPFINFALGDALLPRQTVVRLLVDGSAVRTAKSGVMEPRRIESFAVADLAGRTARLEIEPPGDGQPPAAGVGPITFSDRPADPGPLADLPDYGTMGLALLGAPAGLASAEATAPLSEPLTGYLGRTLRLAPGAQAEITFLSTWSFPNLRLGRLGWVGRHSAVRFPTALAAAGHVAGDFARLHAQTRLWRDTWYDSTLPFWLLDRTMLNTSSLATATSHRFANGRFWGWEGVGCCSGTCTHVWGYAQAVGRLFPELERDLRERTDFGIALDASGRINYRGELPNNEKSSGWAVDGQSMIILRTLREHQVSPDDAFLRRIWPAAKRALTGLITRDPDADGILDGPQHNTLDSAWFGENAWLSGLYVAALRAGEELARDAGDVAFASRCHGIFERGRTRLARELFNGEYYINKPDSAHLDAINSGSGCHIDQVLGQSWACQVGLGRVLPEAETRTALRSLWRYNFAPDVGPYRTANKPGRWYAMPGEAGLLMTTFPRADWSYAQARGDNQQATFAGYFNECMNGFEYQAAGHMIWEGLVLEGLAVTRAVHDRYSATRRNPWNEVECGDHYARSMASYGVFLAVCGFEYHGPKGHLGFAPRLTPEDFRAPFTAAEGWGTFAQKQTDHALVASVALKWGRLRLRTLALQPPATVGRVVAQLDGRFVAATLQMVEGRATVNFVETLDLGAGQHLEIRLS